MPRNEFMNHDFLEGLTDLQIQDMLREGKCTVNDVRRHRGLPEPAWEGPQEVPIQEAETVESSPEPSLAELRKSGESTTEALRRKTAT